MLCTLVRRVFSESQFASKDLGFSNNVALRTCKSWRWPCLSLVLLFLCFLSDTSPHAFCSSALSILSVQGYCQLCPSTAIPSLNPFFPGQSGGKDTFDLLIEVDLISLKILGFIYCNLRDVLHISTKSHPDHYLGPNVYLGQLCWVKSSHCRHLKTFFKKTRFLTFM